MGPGHRRHPQVQGGFGGTEVTWVDARDLPLDRVGDAVLGMAYPPTAPGSGWGASPPASAAAVDYRGAHRLTRSRGRRGRATIETTMDLARLRSAPAAVVQRITRTGDPSPVPGPELADLIAEARRHRPTINVALIERAHEVASTAHEGQLRASGEPYITHPTAVAYELATLQMDAETLAAGLLHDVRRTPAIRWSISRSASAARSRASSTA